MAAWWVPLLIEAGKMTLEILMDAATQTVKKWLTNTVSNLAGAATKMLQAQTGVLGFLGDKMADFVGNVEDVVKERIADSLNTINRMGQKQLGVWNAAERNLKNLTNWVDTQFERGSNWVRKQIGPKLEQLGDQLGFTEDAVKEIGERKIGMSREGLQGFNRYLNSIATSTVDSSEVQHAGIFKWLKNKAGWIKDQVTGGFNNALSWMKDKGVKLASTVAAFVSGIGQALFNAVQFLLHGLIKIFEVDPEMAMDQASNFLEQFLGMGGGMPTQPPERPEWPTT